METYWVAFNRKYGKACLGYSLETILESFWHYFNGRENEAIKLIGLKRKIK